MKRLTAWCKAFPTEGQSVGILCLVYGIWGLLIGLDIGLHWR